MDAYKLFFDGGLRKNEITYGFVLYKNNEVLTKQGGTLHYNASSNVAEYMGLVIGLMHCNILGIKEISIYGDSLLIVSQINGKFKVKSKKLIQYHSISKALLSKFDKYQINWVPRAVNNLADRETRNS